MDTITTMLFFLLAVAAAVAVSSIIIFCGESLPTRRREKLATRAKQEQEALRQDAETARSAMLNEASRGYTNGRWWSN